MLLISLKKQLLSAYYLSLSLSLICKYCLCQQKVHSLVSQSQAYYPETLHLYK